MRDDTIQFSDTGMVLTGSRSKPLLLAFFIDPFTKNVCTTLVNKDDGVNVDTSSPAYTLAVKSHPLTGLQALLVVHHAFFFNR